jgi:hypothetical protein
MAMRIAGEKQQSTSLLLLLGIAFVVKCQGTNHKRVCRVWMDSTIKQISLWQWSDDQKQNENSNLDGDEVASKQCVH